MQSNFAARLCLASLFVAVSYTVSSSAAPAAEGGLNRNELTVRQQTIQAAMTTLRYKMSTLDERYKKRFIPEGQYTLESLKLRVEEQQLWVRDSKWRVDDAKLRVKEAQEYVLKCMEVQQQKQQKLMEVQQELKEAQSIK